MADSEFEAWFESTFGKRPTLEPPHAIRARLVAAEERAAHWRIIQQEALMWDLRKTAARYAWNAQKEKCEAGKEELKPPKVEPQAEPPGIADVLEVQQIGQQYGDSWQVTADKLETRLDMFEQESQNTRKWLEALEKQVNLLQADCHKEIVNFTSGWKPKKRGYPRKMRKHLSEMQTRPISGAK